jgi:hypothetical protein
VSSSSRTKVAGISPATIEQNRQSATAGIVRVNEAGPARVLTA